MMDAINIVNVFIWIRQMCLDDFTSYDDIYIL